MAEPLHRRSGAATLVAIGRFGRGARAGLIPVTLYVSSGCECCHLWVGHLEDQGFRVQTRFLTDVGPKKDALGVPASLRSCHTAEIDGYVVEGHVPAAVIKRFLAERLSDRGLAAPGMPGGSPGMENVPKEAFAVIVFSANGTTRVYARV